MAFTWIPVLLTCAAGALACLNAPECTAIVDEAMTASNANNMAEYCRLRSKANACFDSDSYDCTNPEQQLEALKTAYYSNCSITAADVTTCTQLTYSCSSLLSAAMTPLSEMNIAGYCSAMDPYLTCVRNAMSSCNDKITIYDVVGSVHSTYDKFCSSDNNNAAMAVCQGLLYNAGCHNSLINVSDALTSLDFSSYCSLMDEYKTCFDQVFVGCDQSLSKESFMQGMDEQYNQYCQGSPVDKCKMMSYSCYPALMAVSNNTDPEHMCSGFKEYFDCVKDKMQACDSSVKMVDVVGPMVASSNMMCGTADGGYCPAIATCMKPMMSQMTTPMPGDVSATPDTMGGLPNMGGSPENPNIIQGCGKTRDLMNCFGTELGKCNASSPRNYRFGDIGGLFETSCQTIASNKDLLTCPQMDECMSSITFPTDPVEISNMYHDPQFWCSMLKSTIACADSSKQCKADRGGIKDLLGEINQVCPEAPLRVTIKTDNGFTATRGGVLTSLSAVLLTLVLIHL